ncbi:MAG: gliding motility-associated C-terminal domain-containing protein, partial [Bacteroidota bacterium]|nr:gliding motility-associated C-terminal domain-containing protein [Bacteroidota bacterium]MDX5430981.1 gliding motility-associated C-terminal domain-containing protein [Bacteroidota bacterium]MDX5469732.1 gliding motility-associated C-terminal domain-containing protein [Bacteroidota bacterium]
HEYRNNVRINTVFRDFQFNIYNCNFTTKAVFNPIKGVCSDTVSFTNASTGNLARYLWDFGIEAEDGDTSNAANPSFIFPGPGKYTISLTAFSDAGCGNTSTKNIHILPKVIDSLYHDSIVCYGEQIRLGNIPAESGVYYQWSPPEGLDDPNTANPVATVIEDKTYTVRKNSISCHVENELNVFKNTIDAFFEHEYLPPCDGLRVKFFAKGTNYDELHWDFGDWTSTRDISILPETQWYYTDTGIVYVRMDVKNEYCVDSFIKPIRIILPEVFTAVIDTFICLGDRIVIGPLNDTSILSFEWSNVDFMSSDTLLYPEIEPTKTVSYVLTKTYATCQTKDSFNVLVNEIPDLSIERSYPDNICAGDSILLWATGDYSFEWFPGQGIRSPLSDSTWVVPDSNQWVYLRTTTIAKCTELDSVYLEMYPMFELNLEPAYVKCLDEVFLPEVDIDSGVYRWTRLGGDFLLDSLREEGVYTLNIETRCQNLLDTFQYRFYHESYCPIDFPNAFTPNGDGVNDTYPYNGDFRNIFGLECTFDSYNLIIFNRWGEIMFRSEDPNEEWDGQYKSNGGIQEVFGYYLSYREWDYCRGGWVVRVKRGNISVLH